MAQHQQQAKPAAQPLADQAAEETVGGVHRAAPPPIRAAGGLVWRRAPSGYEIAVVHRERYDDWTLPKGKLDKDEGWQAAAVREVREETGHDVSLAGFAGAIAYITDKGPKVVRYWHMIAGPEERPVDDEVDQVAWLPVDQARQVVNYPLERALLEVWQGPGEAVP